MTFLPVVLTVVCRFHQMTTTRTCDSEKQGQASRSQTIKLTLKSLTEKHNGIPIGYAFILKTETDVTQATRKQSLQGFVI